MFKYISWYMFGVVLCSLVVWSVIGYVAFHFISKFW